MGLINERTGIENCDSLQSYSYRPVTTCERSLGKKIFDSPPFFPTCQIIPFENEGCGKSMNDLVKKLK